MMIDPLKKIARRLNLEETVRWSPVYRFIRDFKNGKLRVAEIRHLSRVIKPGALCFDIGANMGSKTNILLRLNARKVLAVEPDPCALATLRARYGKHPKVVIVDKAASDKVCVLYT